MADSFYTQQVAVTKKNLRLQQLMKQIKTSIVLLDALLEDSNHEIDGFSREVEENLFPLVSELKDYILTIRPQASFRFYDWDPMYVEDSENLAPNISKRPPTKSNMQLSIQNQHDSLCTNRGHQYTIMHQSQPEVLSRLLVGR